MNIIVNCDQGGTIYGLAVLREGLDVSGTPVRRYIPKKVEFSFSYQVDYRYASV